VLNMKDIQKIFQTIEKKGLSINEADKKRIEEDWESWCKSGYKFALQYSIKGPADIRSNARGQIKFQRTCYKDGKPIYSESIIYVLSNGFNRELRILNTYYNRFEISEENGF